MKVIDDFSCGIKVLDGESITLSDGTILRAKIWMPDNANAKPVPAILEYLPYRYQDGTAPRDALTHPYFAGNGYASIRVDMRGSGNSEGVLLGEYLRQEQDDAIEIIDWIRARQWCSGSVGIIGISWGGFNGLQIAARRPEGLKAIVSICSTHDRYAVDIHYMGGAMLCDNIAWSAYMFSLNTTPPDPMIVGKSWREVWLDRLRESGLWLEDWMDHQHRDDFYKHGSVCENYGDIECAVYMVGGWADAYSNSVFQVLSNLSAPCKGLIGPWAHQYPHFAKPEPAIGFLQECLRWWDYWLKGKRNGIMAEPKLRCWMQESVRPATRYDRRPGNWVSEETWPSPRIEEKVYYLGKGTLLDKVPGGVVEEIVASPQSTGAYSGAWCPHAMASDQPGDQRFEAGSSVNFESAPLGSSVEILGAPVASLELSCDKPVGQLAVCLNEVRPDGSALRISYGILNLTHRNSHESPEPVKPDEFFRVRVQLNEIAHRFSAGNKIRLSVSNAYWPLIWPAPEKNKVILRASSSELTLPVRPLREMDRELPEFPEPESAAPLRRTLLREPNGDWTLSTDMQSGIVTTRIWVDEGVTRFDEYGGWTVESTHEEIYSIHPDDPCSARCRIVWTEKFSRDDWEVSSRTTTDVSSNPREFLLRANLEAWEGDAIVHECSWCREIERKCV